MRRSLALASVSVLSIGLLAACSSDDGEKVGGMTECTDQIINDEAQKVVDAESGGANQW